MREFFTSETVKKRYYTEKEKARLYLQSIDDTRYLTAVNKCLSDISIATIQDDIIRKRALTFNGLPAIVDQLVRIMTTDAPTIRSMVKK